MDIAPSPVFNTIDLAWAKYARSGLPHPSAQRLLKRGDIPSSLVDFFRGFYSLAQDVSIKVEYANLDNPGHVMILPKNYLIRLNESYRGWHDAEAAIMAHEMVHVLMGDLGIEGRTRLEDEIFTDSFAVFLGTALVSNFSSSVDFYADGALVNRLGYLKKNERSYALARFVREAGMTPPSHPGGEWRMSDLSGLKASLSLLDARRDAVFSRRPPKHPGSPCARCAAETEKLGEGVLGCPLCGAEWKKGWFRASARMS